MTPAAPRTHVRAPSSPLQPNYSRTFNVLYRSHSIFAHVHNSRVVEWLKICHLSRALAGARNGELHRGPCIRVRVLYARCVYCTQCAVCVYIVIAVIYTRACGRPHAPRRRPTNTTYAYNQRPRIPPDGRPQGMGPQRRSWLSVAPEPVTSLSRLGHAGLSSSQRTAATAHTPWVDRVPTSHTLRRLCCSNACCTS